MIFDKMFMQNDVLELAMKGSEYKNQTILNNIANADTPGFKAKDVQFEGILKDAIDTYDRTGDLDLNSVEAKLYTRHRNYSVRIDDNNVDIESELVNFYKNSTKYDVISNSVINNNSRLNSVFTGMK